MELQRIEAALTAPWMEQNWRDILSEWTDSSVVEKEMVLRRVLSLRDEFLQVARDIDDPETLDMVAAIRYIELKSHWIMLNTQLNYITVFQGEADMAIAYQASLVSNLLAVLERLIDDRDIDRILDFLSEPIAVKDECCPA